MAATPSIKIFKSMSYRGVTREWSNRYHFNGGTPADSAHWTTLAGAIKTAEAATMTSQVTYTRWIGYAAGSEVPVANGTLSGTGTLTTTTELRQAGDVAALVRYSTAVRTSKNHPVYLFNYYHDAFSQSAAAPDQLATVQKTALSTYAAQWLSGFSDGTLTLVRAGPNGATATGQLVEPNLTHRDFPR